MGFEARWLYIIVLVFFLTCSTGESMKKNETRDSLDALLEEYAYKSLVHSHTGVIYNATLPSNITGMNVSAVRVRTEKFWEQGMNISEFRLPPKILPDPFVNRVTLVYQNLGNWSSVYYNVPGYTMVAPVIGLMVYNASDVGHNNSARVNITTIEEPISIRFSHLKLPEHSSFTIKCVRFGERGLIEFTDMEVGNVCLSHDQGHFTVAVTEVEPLKPEPPVQPPTPEPGMKSKLKQKERLWKWLVVGFALGFATLVLLGLIVMMFYKCVKKRRIEKMEKQADAGESFENVWIGMSRMPAATVTRTQPVLEHNEVP